MSKSTGFYVTEPEQPFVRIMSHTVSTSIGPAPYLYFQNLTSIGHPKSHRQHLNSQGVNIYHKNQHSFIVTPCVTESFEQGSSVPAFDV